MKLRKILLPLYLVLLLFSCDKDDDSDCCDPLNPKCSNYDPCLGKNPVSADFTVFESHIRYDEKWRRYDTDTLWPVNAIFIAQEEDAEYTWIIGSETLTTRSVTRTDFPIGEHIPITLIVEKEPNLQCFPNDDGRDTLTRNIFVFDSSSEPLLIEGTYRGSNTDDPNNTFEVTINLSDTSFAGPDRPKPSIEGLPYSCGKVFYAQNRSFGYKQFFFGDNAGKECHWPTGIAKVEGHDLTIDYTVTLDKQSFFSDRISKQFKGTRIN